MRKNIRYSFAAAFAAAAISTSTAAAAVPAWFDGGDRDQDGRLTWSEFVREGSRFDVLDENGDGRITERDRFMADGVVESSWVYAASMDADRSGVVTWAEYHEQLRASFDRYDRNGDDSISAREADGARRGRAQEEGRSGARESTARSRTPGA